MPLLIIPAVVYSAIIACVVKKGIENTQTYHQFSKKREVSKKKAVVESYENGSYYQQAYNSLFGKTQQEIENETKEWLDNLSKKGVKNA